MADAPLLKAKWLLLLELLKAPAVLALIGLLGGVGGTLATQKIAAPASRMEIPASDKPASTPLQKQIDDAVNRLDGRMTEVLGVCGLGVDELQALRKDFNTPRYKAKPAPAK